MVKFRKEIILCLSALIVKILLWINGIARYEYTRNWDIPDQYEVASIAGKWRERRGEPDLFQPMTLLGGKGLRN